MKSVISKLYNGEIFPAETVVPTDSGYRSSVNKVGQEINGLQEVLTREQQKTRKRNGYERRNSQHGEQSNLCRGYPIRDRTHD